ncbi:MAG: hypothetical protein ACFFDP_06415 [Promethearchaeota archaeon]
MTPSTSKTKTKRKTSESSSAPKPTPGAASELQREVMEELKEVFLRGDLPKPKRRDNIVMTRLWNSDLRIVDALIALEIFKSRSEAVAFLVHEGIQAKHLLVDTILPAIERIEEIKRKTREEAVQALHKSKRSEKD